MLAEQEHSTTEGPTQVEDICGVHQLLEQQLKEANDTIAALKEQLKLLQSKTR